MISNDNDGGGTAGDDPVPWSVISAVKGGPLVRAKHEFATAENSCTSSCIDA